MSSGYVSGRRSKDTTSLCTCRVSGTKTAINSNVHSGAAQCLDFVRDLALLLRVSKSRIGDVPRGRELGHGDATHCRPLGLEPETRVDLPESLLRPCLVRHNTQDDQLRSKTLGRT